MLVCDVLCSRIRNKIYEIRKNMSQKARKIHPIFPRICFYITLLKILLLGKNFVDLF